MVLAVLAHRVEAVDHREYARGLRNLLALKPVGVAAPVPTLVVMADDRDHRVREIHALHDLRAHDRVHLHLVELGGRELAGLVEDVIGDGDLAHVVQQRARLERFYLRLAQPEMAGQPARVNLHAVDVIVSDIVFGIDGRGERFDRSQVQAADALGGLRALVGLLEVEMTGREYDGDQRPRRQQRAYPVMLDRQIDQPGRRRARDKGQARPAIVRPPERDQRRASF